MWHTALQVQKDLAKRGIFTTVLGVRWVRPLDTDFSPDAAILGIETSCDETAAAVVENGRVALSDVVSTQIDIHRRWGGVVPEIASRNHVVQVMPVIDEALRLFPPACLCV